MRPPLCVALKVSWEETPELFDLFCLEEMIEMAVLHLQNHVSKLVNSNYIHRFLVAFLDIQRVCLVFGADLLNPDDGLRTMKIESILMSWVPHYGIVEVLVVVFEMRERF